MKVKNALARAWNVGKAQSKGEPRDIIMSSRHLVIYAIRTTPYYFILTGIDRVLHLVLILASALAFSVPNGHILSDYV